MLNEKWSPSVILVDAEFLDGVAFDLIVNFERMLGRRIPPGALCRWLDCIALDGGLRPGENAVQALFIHGKGRGALKNFTPSSFAGELDGKAFRDNLGEFSLHSFPVEEVVAKDEFFLQSLAALLSAEETERLMVVADLDTYGPRVKSLCAAAPRGKEVTLFAMQPLSGRGFSQEILGYSLMSALGIRGDELR